MHFRSNKRVKPTAVIVPVFFGIVFLVAVFFHNTLFGYLTALVNLSSVSKTDQYALLSKKDLSARLVEAEERLSRVSYQAVLYTILFEENKKLERALALRPDMAVGTGRVIARPPRTHFDTFLVELNADNVVRVGDQVFFENFLLGEVVTVSKQSARVSLFSSSGTTIDARVGAPSGIVVMRGLGGGSFVFDIPDQVVISVGDPITDQSQGTHIIAFVDSIVEHPDSTLKTVRAYTPVSFSNINYVTFVRTNSDL